MTINPDLEVQQDMVLSGTFHTYYEKLKKTYTIFALDCKDLEIRELTFSIDTGNTMLIKLDKSYICIRPKGHSCIQEVEKLYAIMSGH